MQFSPSPQRPKVSSVALELTAHCNQKCAYCYNEWREDQGYSMGAPRQSTLLARIDKLIDELDIDHFTITGGEPFAHHDVFAVLEHISARGVRLQMISNGGLIDDAIAKRLAPLNVGYVQVTLNAPDASLHDEHVGGSGHYARTIEGIKALQRHGVPVIGCIVITKKNAHLVSAILELWRSLGVKYISLSRFSPAGYAVSHAAQLLCTRDELTTAFEQAHPFAKSDMRITVTMPVPPCAVEVERFSPIGFGTCPIGTSMQEFALGPDGKLKNCTLHRTAIGGVADILDPSVKLADLLLAKEVTEYRARVPEFCVGCLHEKSCGGGCGAAAEWISGDARGFPDPLVWQHVDDDLAARFAAERTPQSPKKRLEVIL